MSAPPPLPWKALLPALGIMIVVQALFVLCYITATSSPKPDGIPFGVVGSTASTAQVVEEVQRAAGSALEVRAYATDADARAAIDDQEIFGALASTGPGTATLYVASAAGPTVARVLTQATPAAASKFGVTVTAQDLKPLPATDSSGLMVFYVALASIVYGYAGTIVALGVLARFPLAQRLGVIAGFSVVGGLVTALVAGPVTGAVPLTYLPFAAISALAMLVAGLVTALALELGGQKAVPIVLLVLLVLGSPSSGGAVAPDLLPGFFRAIGQWLPPGAAVTALRNNVYFADHQHWMPFLVLFAWVAVCLAGLVLLARRSPRPVARG